MNKLHCIGNLGRDAEVRLVPRVGGSSLPVVNFSLAVKIGYGDTETTEWRDCSYWGERAQKVSRFLTKGKQLLVVGEPTLRSYPKKDGSTGCVMSIRVDELHFVGGKPGEGAAAPAETETKTIMSPAVSPAAEADVPY
jgi:single-strand DNA-binding protein